MPSSSSRKNLVIAMALAGAALLALSRWALPVLADLRPISDGSGTYASSDERLRLAVWEAPRPLEGALDTPARESHARLSPDGRWLAFVGGEPGQGTELFLAEVVGGVPGEPRALVELNSASDELAPAWSADALYFASDRAGGAGGFDLYRASWDGASFGAAQALGGALATRANELDPAPSAGALYFASDRNGTDYDLYVERADGDGARRVERVELLCSAADEREPFVTTDGRALYFASNRKLGGADFDLHRSFREGDAWLEPQRLAGLDSAAAERAPAVSADGFTLYFGRDLGADRELWQARSIELFRGAEPARGWADLLLMAALLLLALVAALSKRWGELELLYKCALASVLAHLAILALLRYLYPDAELWDQPEQRQPRIRVRLEAPRERLRGLVERGGALESQRNSRERAAAPERLELAQLQPTDVPAPEPSELVRAEAVPEAAPARGDLALERTLEAGAAVAPQLAPPREERTLRRADEAPDALPSASVASAQRARSDFAGPAPVTRARTPDEDHAPSPSRIARRTEDAPTESQAGSFEPAEVERSSESSVAIAAPRVALPGEERPRLQSGPRPALDVEARSFSEARSSAVDAEDDSGLQRAPLTQAGSAPPPDRAPELRDLERGAAPMLAAPSEYVAAAAEPASAPGETSRGPELALPSEPVSRAPLGGASSDPGSELAPAAIAAQRRADSRSGDGPAERVRATTGEEVVPESVAPPSRPLAAGAPPAADSVPVAPRRLDDTPYRSRFGTEKEIALREHGGTAETELAVASGLRYLAAKQRRDGSWGARSDRHEKYRDVRVGKSALALLAFLGAGHTPGSETEHAAVADRAVRWLLSTQDARTGHFGDSEAYGHGIATYALAECFALTRDERLGEAVQRGVERILSQQFARGDARTLGGWSYYYPDGAIFDRWPRASITAWQVMALESARLGGFAVPDEAFGRAREFLLNCWDDELGRFRYSHDPQRLRSGYATLPGSTPAALFALSLLGEDLAEPQWSAAVGFVDACAPDGYEWEGEDAFVQRARGNLYFWYYGSLALFRRGGAAWERWNAALKESLPPAQQADGSWVPLDVYGEYAGDDDGERIYSTAMCVLSLEVYYRYFTPLLKVR